MSRSIRVQLGCAAAIAALLPVLASAQSAGPVASVDQVRARFVDAGYQVDKPSIWWTNGSTTFVMHDRVERADPSARVVMVLVYPDLETAQAERQHAQVNVSDGVTAAGELGPRLVPGYGLSVWQGNVAMVASTWGELNRQYQAQIETDLGTPISVGRPQIIEQNLGTRTAVTTRVDPDFVATLNQGGTTADL